MVQSMVRAGIREEAVALCLEIDPKTLRKYYRRELDTAKPMALTKVANSLFAKAVSNDHPQAVTAAIFIMRTQGGWVDTMNLNHRGKDGADAIKQEIVVKVDGDDAKL